MHVSPCFLALLALLLSSCAPYGASFRELRIVGHEGADVWRAVQEFSTSRGLPPDVKECDVGRRIFQTRWVGQSGAFGRSRRRRLRAEIIPSEREGSKWLVRYYVEVEQVNDTSKNMAPEEDDWEFANQDGLMEQMFRRVLAMRFRSTEAPDSEGRTGDRGKLPGDEPLSTRGR